MAPRHREYDPDHALEAAMHLFWLRGYSATSMQDLVDHTGVNRSSLYDTFGNKEELFLACCERYRALMETQRFFELDHAASGLDGIERFFKVCVEAFASDPDRRGCMVFNEIMAVGCENHPIRDFATSILKRLEDAFEQAVERAQQTAEIDSSHDARSLARYLVSLTAGISFQSRAGASRRQIEDVAEAGLACLEVAEQMAHA